MIEASTAASYLATTVSVGITSVGITSVGIASVGISSVGLPFVVLSNSFF